MTSKSTGRPFLRWWWLAGPFNQNAVDNQLRWIASQRFGGVEIAWIRPTWYGKQSAENIEPEWLSPEWSRLVAFTKRRATELGLRCDLTFGSSWPLGGTYIGREHASKTFSGLSTEWVDCSWEPLEAGPPFVLDHLSSDSLRHYAKSMIPAFEPALVGEVSALFCDSLELDTEGLWNPRCWDEFEDQFGYRLEPFADALDDHDGVRYDYRKFISDTMCREFYVEFSAICHEHGAVSRVQCHGSPTDLIASYAAVDIPESEVLLFEPHFSRIAASAASLTGKQIVSCETFSCIYGFPSAHNLMPTKRKHESICDLKLLADSVFANGVNRIVWHGMPFNDSTGCNEFYASVHVGPDAAFAKELPQFNAYLTTVCEQLQRGHTLSRLAILLPNEDRWMQGRIAEDQRHPGANYCWEMRDVRVSKELQIFNPLWISGPFLADAVSHDGALIIGSQRFDALYIDVQWLDAETLRSCHRLAESGAKIVLRNEPKQPGYIRDNGYSEILETLCSLTNVVSTVEEADITPLVDGAMLPPYWIRQDGDMLILFFAHPGAADVVYPMQYDQGRTLKFQHREVRVRCGEFDISLPLEFEPGASILLRIQEDGEVESIALPLFR